LIGVIGSGFLLFTECIGDLVGGCYACHVGHGVLDYNTVLDVDAADGGEGSGGGTVIGWELGDDGEWLGGVDGHAGAVEGGVTEAVGVEITTVFVANAVVSVGGSVAAGVSSTRSLSGRRADVGGES